MKTSRTSRLAGLACAMLALLGFTAPSLNADTLLFDFGGTANPMANPTSGLYWNNVTLTIGGTNSGSLTNLVNSANEATGINFQMVSRFNPSTANASGTTASTLFPSNATRDSLFGNTGVFNTYSNLTPKFKLTGLDVGSTYDFVFYASRESGTVDNREAEYRVTGTTTSSAFLDPYNNVNTSVSVTGITPNASGEILIELFAGPNNNQSAKFIYLGVMTVTGTSNVPEPSAAALFAGAGVLGLVAVRRRRRE